MTEMKGSRLAILLLAVLTVSALFLYSTYAITPNGASLTPFAPQTVNTTTAGNNSAMAGNITELNINGKSVTQTWQGYYGNISGTIELADASGDVLYNWSLASPSGEIYASVNATVSWSNIQCFNFTANGSNMAGTGESAGGTNLGGMNLTALETAFGVVSSDVDGVNETFSDANSHVQFFTASRQFSAGECLSSDIFDSTGQSTDGNFEEVLLYEPTTASVVFAALLENNLNGFDARVHDFQMLVLENGHDGDVGSTVYYFFAELE